MKSIALAISSLFAALLALGQWEAQTTTAPETAALAATDGSALDGTWYAFPAGLLLTFEGQERVHFGDPASGYTADIQFVDDKLYLRFTDYDGDSMACRNETGVYTVVRIDDSVRFEPLSESCQLRLHGLSGRPDFQPQLRFQRAG